MTNLHYFTFAIGKCKFSWQSVILKRPYRASRTSTLLSINVERLLFGYLEIFSPRARFTLLPLVTFAVVQMQANCGATSVMGHIIKILPLWSSKANNTANSARCPRRWRVCFSIFQPEMREGINISPSTTLGSYFRMPTATFYRSATCGGKFSDRGVDLIRPLPLFHIYLLYFFFQSREMVGVSNVNKRGAVQREARLNRNPLLS